VPRMVIENEILEQVYEDKWRLDRVIELISKHKEPWKIVSSLKNDNLISLVDTNEKPLPDWKVEKIIREETMNVIPEVFVVVTEKGLERANG
jgi:hypothetical protein